MKYLFAALLSLSTHAFAEGPHMEDLFIVLDTLEYEFRDAVFYRQQSPIPLEMDQSCRYLTVFNWQIRCAAEGGEPVVVGQAVDTWGQDDMGELVFVVEWNERARLEGTRFSVKPL